MKRVLRVSLLTLCLLVPTAYADEKNDVLKAQRAATAWLALTDAGRYAASWDAGASLFKAGVSKADWEKALTQIRTPLGNLRSRKLRSATFTPNLPGAPTGQYVIIQFDTDFANRAASVETVTPMLDTDGAWRVSGYFIK